VAAGRTAAWEAVPQKKPGTDREKTRKAEVKAPSEGITQSLLSYVGLAAALVVVLLGILLMIGSSRG
jgi:hypothetical protein